MSQHTARHDQHARSEDEDEDVAQARPPERRLGPQPRRPVGLMPPGDGDGGVDPDEPEAGEFELIGDNDLGAADLGPAAPDARDPDAGSGQMRKIAR
jgi:hypothetical protein